MPRKTIFFLLLMLALTPGMYAATLKGSIYNAHLEPEVDVLVEINSSPSQRLLSKDGNYQFELPLGPYTLTARKGEITTTEIISLTKEGLFVVDVFLFPDLNDENDLWQETELDVANETILDTSSDWIYGSFGIVILLLLLVIFLYKSKYSPLRRYVGRVEKKVEVTVDESIAQTIIPHPESGYLREAITIIAKHDGRITQKELRQEMPQLSEAKISLIITELEHEGKLKKIKQGRGNVIILSNVN